MKIISLPVKKVILLLFLIVLSSMVHAQFKRAALLKPSLTLSYEKNPSVEITDTTGSYGADAVEALFRLPLITRMSKGGKAGSFGFWGILLNAGGTYTWPHFSWLAARQQLINARTGLNGIYYGGGKSIFLLNGNVVVGEDNYTINKPVFRYTGSLIMMHQLNDVFSYTVGVAYSFVFGGGLPTPVLGGQVNMGHRNRLHFMLPFNISYSYKFNDRNRFYVFIKPAGGMNYISNRQQFTGYPEEVILRQRIFRLGAALDLALGNNFRLLPEAGVNGKRMLAFSQHGSDRKDNFFEMSTTAGFYLKLALHVRFGNKPSYGKNDAINYLLDNGIDNLPMEEMEK